MTETKYRMPFKTKYKMLVRVLDFVVNFARDLFCENCSLFITLLGFSGIYMCPLEWPKIGRAHV